MNVLSAGLIFTAHLGLLTALSVDTYMSGVLVERTNRMIEQKKREMYSLIEKHYRDNNDRLVKMYSRFLGSKERAEDILQEAYTRALTYWEAYDTEKPFDKWFNSIISSALRDNKRAENMHGMVDIKEAIEVPIRPSAIPAIILKEVLQCIDRKDDTTSNILRLTLVQHYRPSEISKLVNVSPNAIRQIVHRFREEIKRDYKWSL